MSEMAMFHQVSAKLPASDHHDEIAISRGNLLVTEQFAFQKIQRNGRAIELDESAPDAPAGAVNGAGQPFTDPATGLQAGTAYSIRGGKSRPRFLFAELYTAVSDYMGYVAKMLQALKAIPRFA
jgi:hypothetical protein